MPSAGTYAPGAKGGKTQSRCLKPRKSRLVLVLLHKAVFFPGKISMLVCFEWDSLAARFNYFGVLQSCTGGIDRVYI